LPSLPYLRWFFLFDDTTGHQLSGLVEENSRNVPTVENIHISTICYKARSDVGSYQRQQDVGWIKKREQVHSG
ncbi:hypothetical protein KCU96_g33, partial [Aureobasidium melanogenum]